MILCLFCVHFHKSVLASLQGTDAFNVIGLKVTANFLSC